MITRRKFLYTSLATTGGVVFSAPALASGFTKISQRRKIRVGGHPWVYAANLPEYDISPALEKIFLDMSYVGLDGVELMHQPLRNSETVELIVELIEDYKIPVIGSSYEANMWNKNQHSQIQEDVENVLSNLEKVGGDSFGVSVGRAPEKKSERQLDDQAEILLNVQKIAEKHGVTVNLHNHTYEIEDDMHDLKGTLKRIPDIKLGPDFNWLVRAGVDPVDFINLYGEKIIFCHLRDQYNDGKWAESIGEGDQDFSAIARALRKNNFNGTAVIELAHEKNFEITRPIRESLAMSREYVRRTMKF